MSDKVIEQRQLLNAYSLQKFQDIQIFFIFFLRVLIDHTWDLISDIGIPFD